MTALKDIIAYVCKTYPSNLQDELSNARVTKMIYLADWRQAIEHGRQISDIDWFFDNYGPYVDDVRKEVAENNSIFDLQHVQNMYGQPKNLIKLKDKNYAPSLSDDQKKSIDHVIEMTKKMYWDTFIKLVYSTYPITSSERYSHLNLLEKASEYKAQKEEKAP